MDTLTCMQTFVRVVEMQSFSKAAKESACSASLASKQVSWLEGRLGAKLLNRSTRRLSLTDTGEAYYLQSLKVLSEAEIATNLVAEVHGKAFGTLRVTCPSGLGATVFNQAFAAFSLKYPTITLETRLTDEFIDFTEGRIDFALRLVSDLDDSSLIAEKLASVQMHVCAAPRYLERHGTPKILQDLQGHNCLRYTHTRTGSDVWHLGNGHASECVPISGNYRANNPMFMKAAVVQGLGIAVLPCYIHQEELKAGLIKHVLPEYKMEDLNLYLVRQHQDHIPLKMKLFASFVKDWVGEHLSAS